MRSRIYGLRNEPNPVFAPRPGRLIAKQSQSAVGSPAWGRVMRSRATDCETNPIASDLPAWFVRLRNKANPPSARQLGVAQLRTTKRTQSGVSPRVGFA